MNEKGNSKVLGIIFVVVVVVLLFAHYTSVNQIKASYETQIKQLSEKSNAIQKDLDANIMKVKVLDFKLKLNEVNLYVSRNDYGTASMMLKKFNEELGKAGCKKLDKLEPLFDLADTKLLKLDKTVVEELKEIETIVFSDKVEQPKEDVKSEAEAEAESATTTEGQK